MTLNIYCDHRLLEYYRKRINVKRVEITELKDEEKGKHSEILNIISDFRLTLLQNCCEVPSVDECFEILFNYKAEEIEESYDLLDLLYFYYKKILKKVFLTK